MPSRTTQQSTRPRASDRSMCCRPGNRRGLPALETDQDSRPHNKDAIEMEPCKSRGTTRPSSYAQGLEGKEISLPSSRGRKTSLTSPLIDQAIALFNPEENTFPDGRRVKSGFCNSSDLGTYLGAGFTSHCGA